MFLGGELDQHEARHTEKRVAELLDEYLPRDCVLDLSSLGFMDSSGIAVIAKLSRQMKQLGGRLWIENPGRQVLRVLDMSGLERMVPVATERLEELT